MGNKQKVALFMGYAHLLNGIQNYCYGAQCLLSVGNEFDRNHDHTIPPGDAFLEAKIGTTADCKCDLNEDPFKCLKANCFYVTEKNVLYMTDSSIAILESGNRIIEDHVPTAPGVASPWGEISETKVTKIDGIEDRYFFFVGSKKIHGKYDTKFKKSIFVFNKSFSSCMPRVFPVANSYLSHDLSFLPILNYCGEIAKDRRYEISLEFLSYRQGAKLSFSKDNGLSKLDSEVDDEHIEYTHTHVINFDSECGIMVSLGPAIFVFDTEKVRFRISSNGGQEATLMRISNDGGCSALEEGVLLDL